MNAMFYNCSKLTSLNLSNFDTSKVIDMNNMFGYCSKLTSLDLSNFDTSAVTDIDRMFCFCSQLTSLDLSNFDTSEVEDMFRVFHLCSKLKFINLKNFTENSLTEYNSMFFGVPDNVIVCLDINNTKILYELKRITNYTLNCSYFLETKEIKIKNVIDNMIKNQVKGKTKEEENKYYDNILKILKEALTSENYDTSDIDNGKEENIETEKMKITITTTKNQKNNMNSNTTIIDLGNCENALKKYYNLSNGSLLYMVKLEVNQDGMKIPKIEYELFSKLKGNNLEKLTLTACKNIKINILHPYEGKDNLDKLNSKSDYYNNICYKAKSDNGTDISLKDRKKEYVNKTVCQDGCNFNNYNYTIKKVNCSCDKQESPKSFANMYIDKDKLLANIKYR